nr:hypothetical protein [uncultured Sphingorhabdus sp.]
MSIILFSLALTAVTTDQSYATSTSEGTFYNNNQTKPYNKTIVVCKSGSSTYNKSVSSAKFELSKVYYANELPYYTDKNGQILQKTSGKYNSFDEAAQKACFG